MGLLISALQSSNLLVAMEGGVYSMVCSWDGEDHVQVILFYGVMGSLWLDMIVVVVEGSSLEAILAPCMASMVELWFGCGLIRCMSILMILLILAS